jgi:hypothetical protein
MRHSPTPIETLQDLIRAFCAIFLIVYLVGTGMQEQVKLSSMNITTVMETFIREISIYTPRSEGTIPMATKKVTVAKDLTTPASFLMTAQQYTLLQMLEIANRSNQAVLILPETDVQGLCIVSNSGKPVPEAGIFMRNNAASLCLHSGSGDMEAALLRQEKLAD